MGPTEERTEGRDQSEQSGGAEASEGLHSLPSDSKLSILFYNEPPLRNENIDIEEVEENITSLVQMLINTMYDSKGVGIAAPQVGINVNIIIIDPQWVHTDNKNPIAMINPKVLDIDDHTFTHREACLSCPMANVELKRANDIEVEYTDIEGKVVSGIFTDWDAAVVQHELDHLKGKMIIDYLSPMQTKMWKGKIRKRKIHAKRMLKRMKADVRSSIVSERRLEGARSRKVRQECSKGTTPEGSGDS